MTCGVVVAGVAVFAGGFAAGATPCACSAPQASSSTPAPVAAFSSDAFNDALSNPCKPVDSIT